VSGRKNFTQKCPKTNFLENSSETDHIPYLNGVFKKNDKKQPNESYIY